MKNFILKIKGNHDDKRSYLYPYEIIIEKIAYDLLALCGVKVPKTYLVEIKKSYREDLLGLASEYVENFNLLEVLVENKTESMVNNQNLKIQYQYKQSFLQQNKLLNHNQTKHLPIVNLYESLPAFAVVFDHEAVGYNLGNAGLVEAEEFFEFVKIDPGAVNFGQMEYISERLQYAFEHFLEDIDTDLDNGLILKCFKEVKETDTAAVFRLREIFHRATKTQKLTGLATINKIQKENIVEIVKKDFYEKYIDEEFLDKFVSVIWTHIANLKSVFQADITQFLLDNPELAKKSLKIPRQKILVRPVEDFLKTNTQMKKGWARPWVYKKIPKSIASKNKSSFFLHKAVIEDDIEQVKSLLLENLNINARDRSGHTPLVYALQKKNELMILLLLANGAMKNSHTAVARETLLHLAARINHVEIFRRIARFDGNLFPLNKRNETPFDVATVCNNAQILQFYALENENAHLIKLLEKILQIKDYVLYKINVAEFGQVEFSAMISKKVTKAGSSVEYWSALAKNALEPIEKLINELQAELSERQQSNSLKSYDAYEEQFSAINIRHPLLKEAMLFVAIGYDVQEAIENFYKNHKSWFGVNPLRDIAIGAIQNCMNSKVYKCNSPLDLLIGEVIHQKNTAQIQHDAQSSFHFFTKSSLSRELSLVLEKYGITAKHEQIFSTYYTKHYSSILNLPVLE